MRYNYIICCISLIFILGGCHEQVVFDLSVIVIPEHAGYVTSDTDKYIPGTSVTLTAYNNTGFLFNYWELYDGYVSRENPLTFIINEDTVIEARFTTLDTKPPVITLFTGPSLTTEPEIDINLEGKDNVRIDGWMITESPDKPLPQSLKWESIKPETYRCTAAGIINLYAWAKDTADNISDSKMITVQVIDNQPPVILEFTGPSLTNSLEIPLTLEGTDNFDQIFWLVTESSFAPPISDPGWVENKPSSYTFPTPGNYTLYAWAKDGAENISESKSFDIIYDGITPYITQFEYDGTECSLSYAIPVKLDGWDDRRISYWAITQSNIQPAPDSSAWVSDKPGTCYLKYHGSNTLYAWVKDEAGNISTGESITVDKCFDGSWTIMIWMDADNEYEHYGMKDINELEYGLFRAQLGDPDIEDHLSIVVQVDRIPGYDNRSYDDGPDWYNTRRYLIKPHAESYFLGDFESQILDDMAEANMGDANELKSFIVYSMVNFPADHYCLILRGSGYSITGMKNRDNNPGQTRAVCTDTTNNDDILFTGEIKDGLSDYEAVDVLGFDAGFTGTVEIAYEFWPDPAIVDFNADYMVASPSATYEEGWRYYKILERFSSAGNTDWDGDTCYDIDTLDPDVLTAIIVKENYDSYFNIEYQTITGINLQLFSGLKNAIDVLVAEITENKDDAEIIRGELASVPLLHYFNESIGNEWIAVPHFDLYNFAEQISIDPLFSADAHTKATALMEILENVVIESWAGFNYPDHVAGKHGLAFIFPDGDRKYGPGADDVHYKLQTWYTYRDLSGINNKQFGNLDFCETIPQNGTVDNWKELLEYWYDFNNTRTEDEW